MCDRLLFKKWNLSSSFRGFLKLQQQTVMIFNARNVIGTLSYVTVIPASVSLQWPLTTVVGKPFRISTLSGNKEFNVFSKKERQSEEKNKWVVHSHFNSLSRFAWIKHKPSRNQGFLAGLNLLMCEKTIIFCTNKPEQLRLCLCVMTIYILNPLTPWNCLQKWYLFLTTHQHRHNWVCSSGYIFAFPVVT